MNVKHSFLMGIIEKYVQYITYKIIYTTQYWIIKSFKFKILIIDDFYTQCFVLFVS